MKPIPSSHKLTIRPLVVAAALVPAVTVTAWAQPVGQERRATLEEVVVTAQRRQENLQEVPISVVAIPADALDAGGIRGTVNLPELVPSVQLGRSGPAGLFFVRGVGNISGASGEEGANAFYVDGVYIYEKQATVLKFNNIERVEVLKGPQGTLFGRNSSGGLVHVITREPGDEVTGKINVGYGKFDTFTGQGYFAAPLTDTLSADIAITATDQRDGWGRSELTGEDVSLGWDWGVRSKWVWRPSDRAKLTLVGDYARESDDYTTSFRMKPGTLGVTGTQPASDPYDTAANDLGFSNQRNAGLGLTAEFDMDWGTLTSITGYRDNDTRTRLDLDAGPLPFAKIDIWSSSSAFQQEFRLSSQDTDPLAWQVGMFFMDAQVDLEPQRISGLAFGGVGVGSETFSTMETRSLAGFGELSWMVTPTTQLTAGLRYTRDKLDFKGRQQPIGSSVVLFSREDSKNFSGETFRLALRQDITDSINVYASYNRGFKSGTFSTQAITIDPVDPQEVDAFEVGLKSELLDRRLRFNAAAFHYRISDYQTRAASTADGASFLLNAAKVEVDGLELEFEAIPAEGLRLFGSATFLKSEFTDFPFAPYSYPNPAVCTPGGPQPGMTTGAAVGGSTFCNGSAKGNKTPHAPKFAGTLGMSYSHAVNAGGEVRMSALYNYNDGYYFESDNRMRQPSFNTLNASLAYHPTPNWGIELWGRNLTDELYFVQRVGSALVDFQVPAAPRTFGINLSYAY